MKRLKTMKIKFSNEKIIDDDDAQKKPLHLYSRFWDKIQKNIMAHVEKDLKKRPSIHQINQRINLYMSTIEKPDNVLFTPGTIQKSNKEDHTKIKVSAEDLKKKQKETEDF